MRKFGQGCAPTLLQTLTDGQALVKDMRPTHAVRRITCASLVKDMRPPPWFPTYSVCKFGQACALTLPYTLTDGQALVKDMRPPPGFRRIACASLVKRGR